MPLLVAHYGSIPVGFAETRILRVIGVTRGLQMVPEMMTQNVARLDCLDRHSCGLQIHMSGT
jgi:hypothetical protein